MGRCGLTIALALVGLALAGCQPEGRPKDPIGNKPEPVTETDPEAPMMEFNFGHRNETYVIRLVDSFAGLGGDLSVMGFDPASPKGAPERIKAVAQAACDAEARYFDDSAQVRKSADGTVWTFVEACL
jgi:hypothetical protein